MGSAYFSVKFRTARGYEFDVARLSDVIKAISMAWPDKECAHYRTASRLAELSKEGWCAPRAAFDAFVRAAQKQGCIVQSRPLRERVAKELGMTGPQTLTTSQAAFPVRRRIRHSFPRPDAKSDTTHT